MFYFDLFIPAAVPVTGTHSACSKSTTRPSLGGSSHCPMVDPYLGAPQCRTAQVYRTLEPFWGEEYTLHVPNEFQAVSVHVFDHDLMG